MWTQHRSGAKRSAVSRGRPQARRRSAPTLPLRGNLKPALMLIGPAPLDVAQQTWSKGLEALSMLGSEALRWNPGILAAAIMTLTEGRTGIRQFWESYREGISGWPKLLAIASEQLLAYKEGRSHVRQAELALYMTNRYCARIPAHRGEGQLLSALRVPFEQYRISALQAAFVGHLSPGDGRSESWSPEPPRRRLARLNVRTATGQTVEIALERDFYRDVCQVLGSDGVRSIIREIGADFDPSKEKFSLSSIIREELTQMIASNLSAAKLLGLKDVSRFVNPKPTKLNGLKKPAIPTHVKRGPDDVPYRRHSQVVVSCGRTLGIATTVSVTRPLYDTACAMLGQRTVNNILRAAADSYDPTSTTLSRSEVARQALLEALCRHAHWVGSKAVKH